MSETEMLNTEQVAKELGISVPTFRRRLAAGEIPKPPMNAHLKRPRRLEWSRADVERLKAPAAPRDGQGEG